MITLRQPQVQVHDRRRRKRIVTLKNFRNLMIVAIAIFAAASIISELRGSRSGDYGRLFAREQPADVQVKKPDVVIEAAPVADAVAADPFSMNAAAREQILRGDAPPLTATVPAQASTIPLRPSEDARIHIVQGSQGVAIVQTDTRRPPVLGGGFGR